MLKSSQCIMNKNEMCNFLKKDNWDQSQRMCTAQLRDQHTAKLLRERETLGRARKETDVTEMKEKWDGQGPVETPGSKGVSLAWVVV